MKINLQTKLKKSANNVDRAEHSRHKTALIAKLH